RRAAAHHYAHAAPRPREQPQPAGPPRGAAGPGWLGPRPFDARAGVALVCSSLGLPISHPDPPGHAVRLWRDEFPKSTLASVRVRAVRSPLRPSSAPTDARRRTRLPRRARVLREARRASRLQTFSVSRNPFRWLVGSTWATCPTTSPTRICSSSSRLTAASAPPR